MNKDRLDKISGLKLDDFRMNTVATEVWLMLVVQLTSDLEKVTLW